MSIELTREQLQAAEASPLRVTDPETRREYVVVRAEDYERLRGLLGEDFDPSEAYPAIDRAFAEGWDDPKMDDYDNHLSGP